MIVCNTFTSFQCVIMHVLSRLLETKAKISLNTVSTNKPAGPIPRNGGTWLNINLYIKCEQAKLRLDIKNKRLLLNQNVSLCCSSTLAYYYKCSRLAQPSCYLLPQITLQSYKKPRVERTPTCPRVCD